nr:immunoglobulin light chain junction region [Macaca mulatta]
CIQGLEFPWTL